MPQEKELLPPSTPHPIRIAPPLKAPTKVKPVGKVSKLIFRLPILSPLANFHSILGRKRDLKNSDYTKSDVEDLD